MGKNTEHVAQKAAKIKDVSSVIRIDGDHLVHLLAEDAAKIVEMLSNNYQVILAAHSWFSRNFLPRVAAILNVSLITDVLKIESDNVFTRAIYAGNVHAKIQSKDHIQLLTIHTSLFEACARDG